MKQALLIAILVLALGVVSRAQTQTAPPTFSTGTQAVLLDVVAKDGEGRSVPDLRADEVQLFEDGSRCAIESFRLVALGHPGLAGREDARHRRRRPRRARPTSSSSSSTNCRSPWHPPHGKALSSC